jgi:hypothetical protein
MYPPPSRLLDNVHALKMSWSSRTNTSTDADGWQTVSGGWRSGSTAGAYKPPISDSSSSSAAANSTRAFDRSAFFGTGQSQQQQQSHYTESSPFNRQRQPQQSEMPSAFSKGKRGDDDRGRRQQEEAAYKQEVFRRKLAELEAKQAAERIDLADDEAFPTLGGGGGSKKVKPAPPPGPAAAAPPKTSWASKMAEWQDEDAIRRRQSAEEEERRKEDDVYIKLNTLNIREDKVPRNNPYISSFGYHCKASTIMEEQDAYDYNKEFHRADDLLEEDDYHPPQGSRAYSPHSPTYPPNFNSDEE